MDSMPALGSNLHLCVNNNLKFKITNGLDYNKNK